MDARRSIRIFLTLLIAAGMVAILWSFLSRHSDGMARLRKQFLSPDVSRRTVHFEYVEHKQGRTVFEVSAETSTEFAAGVHTLKEVRLARFDEAGQSVDSISGQRAVYETKQKQIEFSGDVEVRLADNTQVFSDQVQADLAAEVVSIKESFRFQRREIRGRGESLVYRIPERKVQIDGRFECAIPTSSGPVEAEARQAFYFLPEHRLELNGQAKISAPARRLTAGKMTIFLAEDWRIQKIASSGHPRLHSGSQLFSGEQINAFFDPDSKRLRYVEVLGRRGDAETPLESKATYQEEAEGRRCHLEAERIIAVPEAGERALSLGQFTAHQDVLFRSSSLEIEEARTDNLTASFYQGQQDLHSLHLRGPRSLIRRIDNQTSSREQLQSDLLSVKFLPGQVIDQVTAMGNVSIRLNRGDGNRYLWARNSLQIDYQKGKLERVRGLGDCVLERVESGEKNILRAPRIDVEYQQGILQKALAQGGVEVELQEEGSIKRATSRRLDVSYQKGEMLEAVQSGDFHFWEHSESSKLDLRSDQAVYHPKTQLVEITGKHNVLRSGSDSPDGNEAETVAERFVIDRGTGEILGLGKVKTMLARKDAPVVITAGRMEADPKTGWVRYSEKPSILQQGNSITGQWVRVSNRDQQLIVENNVESSLGKSMEKGSQEYWIGADRLMYDHQKNRALYEGKVRIRSEVLSAKAPFVEILFASNDMSRLRQIEAWGEVEITEMERKAKGNRAVYYPAEKKVVITGDYAQVIEPKRGKAWGRQVTFYLGKDQVFIEGPLPQSEP